MNKDLDNLKPWQMQARHTAASDQAEAELCEAEAMVRAWNREHPDEPPITVEELEGLS